MLLQSFCRRLAINVVSSYWDMKVWTKILHACVHTPSSCAASAQPLCLVRLTHGLEAAWPQTDGKHLSGFYSAEHVLFAEQLENRFVNRRNLQVAFSSCQGFWGPHKCQTVILSSPALSLSRSSFLWEFPAEVWDLQQSDALHQRLLCSNSLNVMHSWDSPLVGKFYNLRHVQLNRTVKLATLNLVFWGDFPKFFRPSSPLCLSPPSEEEDYSDINSEEALCPQSFSPCKLAWKISHPLLRCAFQISDVPSGGADAVAFGPHGRHLQTLSRSRPKPSSMEEKKRFLMWVLEKSVEVCSDASSIYVRLWSINHAAKGGTMTSQPVAPAETCRAARTVFFLQRCCQYEQAGIRTENLPVLVLCGTKQTVTVESKNSIGTILVLSNVISWSVVVTELMTLSMSQTEIKWNSML